MPTGWAEHTPLEAVLNGTLLPHQSLVIITDSAVFSGLNVFKEALRRALNRSSSVVLVTALHQPSTLVSNAQNLSTIDLTTDIPGFSSSAAWDDISRRILSIATPEGQIFIDALDVLAEDYSPLNITRLTSTLLSQTKPPGRLVLLLPHTSSLLHTLIPPSFSPALTLLHVVHPKAVEYLSRSYLAPVSSDTNFWMILERARERKVPEQLAYTGSEGVEVGDWSAGGVVQVTVRKPTGGVKGITRSLAALSSSGASTSSTPLKEGTGDLIVGPVSDILDPSPFAAPSQSNIKVERPAQTPAEMNLPFNLSLTDEQKRRRGQVPLPYAHEGEGVELMDFGDDEDEDDEEI